MPRFKIRTLKHEYIFSRALRHAIDEVVSPSLSPDSSWETNVVCVLWAGVEPVPVVGCCPLGLSLVEYLASGADKLWEAGVALSNIDDLFVSLWCIAHSLKCGCVALSEVIEDLLLWPWSTVVGEGCSLLSLYLHCSLSEFLRKSCCVCKTEHSAYSHDDL